MGSTAWIALVLRHSIGAEGEGVRVYRYPTPCEKALVEDLLEDLLL